MPACLTAFEFFCRSVGLPFCFKELLINMYNPDLCESLILISFLCSNEKRKKKRQDADEILAGVGGICISRIRFCRYGNLCVYNGFLLLRYGPNNYKMLKAGPSHTHTTHIHSKRDEKSPECVTGKWGHQHQWWWWWWCRHSCCCWWSWWRC